jgi:hypothetical protein
MIVWLIFFAVLGACIGSFINVLVYRLPAGLSIVRPPSSCPKCGHRLAWYDNVPVLGWLWLKGRCRYCRAPVSAQYPIVEAITALLFAGWFYICYMTPLRPAFAGPGMAATWPVFFAYLVLLTVLLASTLIDARHYIIPLELPWTATIAAVILMPAGVLLYPDQVVTPVAAPMADVFGEPLTARKRLEQVRPAVHRQAAEVRIAVDLYRPGPIEVSAAPITSTRASIAALGALAGLAIAIGLLWRRILPYSFEQDVPRRKGRSIRTSGWRTRTRVARCSRSACSFRCRWPAV